MVKSPELYLAPTRILNYFTNEQSLCHDSPKIHDDGLFRCNSLNMNGLYSLILFPGRQEEKKKEMVSNGNIICKAQNSHTVKSKGRECSSQPFLPSFQWELGAAPALFL